MYASYRSLSSSNFQARFSFLIPRSDCLVEQSNYQTHFSLRSEGPHEMLDLMPCIGVWLNILVWFEIICVRSFEYSQLGYDIERPQLWSILSVSTQKFWKLNYDAEFFFQIKTSWISYSNFIFSPAKSHVFKIYIGFSAFDFLINRQEAIRKGISLLFSCWRKAKWKIEKFVFYHA